MDHIIPRAVCPELDNVIANLELMPMGLNSAKRDRVGDRQLSLAKALSRNQPTPRCRPENLSYTQDSLSPSMDVSRHRPLKASVVV